jgi:hypothetical protein
MRRALLPTPLALAPIALVGACVPTVEAPPAPSSAPVVQPVAPPPPRPRPVDWQDWPVTPGRWRYDAATRSASFGSVRLACIPAARQLVFATGVPAPGPVTIRTTSTVRALPASPDGQVRLAAADRLLDAIAFSRGRFTVEVPGRAPMVLPPHAEIGRVIEDCRAG